jgi:ketosteroid isomerase-like protein
MIKADIPMRAHLFSLILLTSAAACGGSGHTIKGTDVEDTSENRDLISYVEKYRLAVERQDAPALVLMASKDYWEDGGTPTGGDDYGYAGLKNVLAGRFQTSEQVRYSIRYLRIRRSGDMAFIEAHVHASWTLEDAHGQLIRKDKKSQEQFVLRYEGEDWKFLSGM